MLTNFFELKKKYLLFRQKFKTCNSLYNMLAYNRYNSNLWKTFAVISFEYTPVVVECENKINIFFYILRDWNKVVTRVLFKSMYKVVLHSCFINCGEIRLNQIIILEIQFEIGL